MVQLNQSCSNSIVIVVVVAAAVMVVVVVVVVAVVVVLVVKVDLLTPLHFVLRCLCLSVKVWTGWSVRLFLVRRYRWMDV